MSGSSSSLVQAHIDSCLLAVASSTDNLAVGISAGLLSSTTSSRQAMTQDRVHFYRVNFVVALCNAAGTFVSSYGGRSLSRVPSLALLKVAAAVTSSSSPETYSLNFKPESAIAAIAFAYLAWQEYSEGSIEIYNDRGDEKSKKASRGLSYSIALPMTLNNLAGGLAGGALGLSAIQATSYAFAVSFLSMSFGYYLATRLVKRATPSAFAPRWCQVMAISIYLLLCLQSLLDL